MSQVKTEFCEFCPSDGGECSLCKSYESYQPVYPAIGVRVEIVVPHSEVCMHMRVAGKRMLAEVIPQTHPVVQLYCQDGRKFSSPILPGEAGFYRDETDGRLFYYPKPQEELDAVEWVK